MLRCPPSCQPPSPRLAISFSGCHSLRPPARPTASAPDRRGLRARGALSRRGLTPQVVGGSVTAAFLPDDRFWYRNTIADGAEFILVDPAKKTRARAFDHQKACASRSSAAAAAPLTRCTSPFRSIDLVSADGAASHSISRPSGGDATPPRSTCAAAGDAVRPAVRAAGGRTRWSRRRTRRRRRPHLVQDGKPLTMSPDGKRAVFIRDWNLWVRDVATRAGARSSRPTASRTSATPPTTPAGRSSDRADRAVVARLEEDRDVAAGRAQGRRDVPGRRPTSATRRCASWKYPLPGDRSWRCCTASSSTSTAGGSCGCRCRPTTTARTLGDDISMRDYNWSPDASQLALVVHRRAITRRPWLRVADAATGAVRTVFEETVATQFESRAGWRVLWATNEVIWYSQRDDWGHLYLYDLDHRRAQEPDHDRRRPGDADRARRREDAHDLVHGATAARRGRIRTSAHFYRIGLDGKGLRRRSRPTTATTTCSSRRRASTSSTRTRRPTSPPVVDAARRATASS